MRGPHRAFLPPSAKSKNLNILSGPLNLKRARGGLSALQKQTSSFDVRAVFGPVAVHVPDAKILLLLYDVHVSSL